MQAEDEKRAEGEAYSLSLRRAEQERRQDWQRQEQTRVASECVALQIAEKQRLQALSRAEEKAYAQGVQRYLHAVDSLYHQRAVTHKVKNAKWREDLRTQVSAKPKVAPLDDRFSPTEAQMNWTIIQCVRRGVARSPMSGNSPQGTDVYQHYSPPHARDLPAFQ